MISRTEIQEASRRIARHVRRTPVFALEEGAFGLDARIFLKLEMLQHTGSFKPRGAFNCILSATVPPAGVIAAQALHFVGGGGWRDKNLCTSPGLLRRKSPRRPTGSPGRPSNAGRGGGCAAKHDV